MPGRDRGADRKRVLTEPLLQLLRGLEQRRADSRNVADGVQQTVIVDQAVVARCDDIDARLIELARVGFEWLRRINGGEPPKRHLVSLC